jgi:hypothetical protein
MSTSKYLPIPSTGNQKKVEIGKYPPLFTPNFMQCTPEDWQVEIAKDKRDGQNYYNYLDTKDFFKDVNTTIKEILRQKMIKEYDFRPKEKDILTLVNELSASTFKYGYAGGNNRTLQKTKKVAKATKVSKNKKNAKPIKNNLNNKIKKGVKGGGMFFTRRCKKDDTALQKGQQTQKTQTLSHVTPTENTIEKQRENNQLIFNSFNSDPNTNMEYVDIDPKTHQLIYQQKTRSMSTPQYSFNQLQQLPYSISGIPVNPVNYAMPATAHATPSRQADNSPFPSVNPGSITGSLPGSFTGSFPGSITGSLPGSFTGSFPGSITGSLTTQPDSHFKYGVRIDDIVRSYGGKLFDFKKFLKATKPTKPKKPTKAAKPANPKKPTKPTKPKKPTKAIKIKKTNKSY